MKEYHGRLGSITSRHMRSILQKCGSLSRSILQRSITNSFWRLLRGITVFACSFLLSYGKTNAPPSCLTLNRFFLLPQSVECRYSRSYLMTVPSIMGRILCSASSLIRYREANLDAGRPVPVSLLQTTLKNSRFFGNMSTQLLNCTETIRAFLHGICSMNREIRIEIMNRSRFL